MSEQTPPSVPVGDSPQKETAPDAIAAAAPAVAAAPAPAEPPPATAAPAETAQADVAAAQMAAEAGDPGVVNPESVAAMLKDADPEGTKNPTIEELLQQANFEDASAVASQPTGPDTESFKLPSFQQVMADAQVSSIDLLRDVELNVKIELGRSRMLVEDVLKLSEGSVVELDKLAGDPVDLFVNERLVARGEVLVLNDNFCVRVNEIMTEVKEEAT